MNIDQMNISTYIQLEGYTFDDIKDFAGDWKNDDYYFDDIVDKVVCAHFKNALKKFAPYLQKIKINSIAIGIDILGTSDGAAGYYHSDSDIESGIYGFAIGADVLNEYLKQYWDKNYQIDAFTMYMWEHEIIHMIDHKNLLEYRYDNSNRDPRVCFIQYLLKYRNEGIADLYYKLKNSREIVSMDMARERFVEELKRIEVLPWKDYENNKMTKEKLLKTSIYYSIGPWIILNILSNSHNTALRQLANSVIDRIAKKQTISETEIMHIIDHALSIDNKTFIEQLTNKGYNDEPFIDLDTLKKVAQAFTETPEKSYEYPVDEEILRETNKVINLFNEYWK